MLKSHNKTWGFFGTSRVNYGFSEDGTEIAFDLCAKAIIEATGAGSSDVCRFLDSKYGRHLADELSYVGAENGMSPKQYASVMKKFLALDRSKWVRREVGAI